MVIAAVVGLVLVPTVAWASLFPINEPFHTATTHNPGWRLLGSATLTNQSDGWLRLTPAMPDRQAGAAILDRPFFSRLGLDIDFQYAAWGGLTTDGRRGDGFAFVLVDGSAAPSVGAWGGLLGFIGMTGAYAGVGFDQWGGFSSPSSPDHITVRGPVYGAPTLGSAPAPGGIGTENNTTGVRSARITIRPDAAGHLLLSALSNRGPGTPLEPVITNLSLDQRPARGALPPTLKLGFSAGTGDATNNYEIRDLHVTVPADLSITKRAPRYVPPGGHVQYTLNVADHGPNPVTGAVVRDQVPTPVTGVTWRCEPGPYSACGTGATGTGHHVISHVSFDKPGATARILVTGTLSRHAKPGSRITNTATITPPPDRNDLTTHNNTATAAFTVSTGKRPGPPSGPPVPVTG